MRLSDLSSEQIRMLARMAGQYAPEDAVGLELDDLKGGAGQTADSLVRLGLAEMKQGWRMTFWFSLTEKGQKLRETGVA